MLRYGDHVKAHFVCEMQDAKKYCGKSDNSLNFINKVRQHPDLNITVI